MGLPGWRAMAARGLTDLSPPEAEHAMLELPVNRAEYVGVLQDLGDYPARTPIGPRIPGEDEVAALRRIAGRWRAVAGLDDERALRTMAALFERAFVLDPFYDTGALLYAAWHDPLIKDEHARRLAQHAALLVRAGPLLASGTAVLAPDHLPGSWSPRPGWRPPRSSDDHRQSAAWSMRTALVLLHWADRLDALICATRADVVAALDVLLGPHARSIAVGVREPERVADGQALREAHAARDLRACWSALRRDSRRRARLGLLADVADGLASLTARLEQRGGEPAAWRLVLGQPRLPDPALLLRRVLNGEDPERQPPLARLKLRRRPLALVPHR